MMKKTIILFILAFICFQNIKSEQGLFLEDIQLSDSSQVSVLTSAPWAAKIYAVYGHSAMRIYDEKSGLDIVFNYGLFDFKAPNFIYRFMAGETDYIVGIVDYKYYLPEYESRGEDVYEQIINLNRDEKQKIWLYLLNNAKKENRVYRYNIFFNNCTTKLRDILEENIDGKVIYPDNKDSKTFRNVVHEHVRLQPWLQFGIDLVIGSDADRPMTIREKIFLPIYEKNIFDQSTIQRKDGRKVPLVINDNLLVTATNTNNDAKNGIVGSPLFIGITVLLLAIISSISNIKKRKVVPSIFHFLLFLIAGLTGCILTFMILFSVHPCTHPNWNIVWLNPLQLIFAFLFFAKSYSKYIYYYHFINFAVLIIFLLAWCLIPQQLEIAYIPFILSIAIISGMVALKQHKLKEKADKQLAKKQ